MMRLSILITTLPLLTILAIMMTESEGRRKSESTKCVNCLKSGKYFHTKLKDIWPKCQDKSSSLVTAAAAGTNDTGVIMTEAGCQNLSTPVKNQLFTITTTPRPLSWKPGISCPSCPPSKPCPKSCPKDDKCPPPILNRLECPSSCAQSPSSSPVPSACPACPSTVSDDDDRAGQQTVDSRSTQLDMIFLRNGSSSITCSSLQINWTMAALITTLVLLSGLVLGQFIIIVVMVTFHRRFRRRHHHHREIEGNGSPQNDLNLESAGHQSPKNETFLSGQVPVRNERRIY